MGVEVGKGGVTEVRVEEGEGVDSGRGTGRGEGGLVFGGCSACGRRWGEMPTLVQHLGQT